LPFIATGSSLAIHPFVQAEDKDPRHKRGGFTLRHACVAKPIVNNNRKQWKLSQRRNLQLLVAFNRGRGGARVRATETPKRLSRSGPVGRGFGEYFFLEDSRYTSQSKNTAQPRLSACAGKCRS
jgi:hypothetical protein